MCNVSFIFLAVIGCSVPEAPDDSRYWINRLGDIVEIGCQVHALNTHSNLHNVLFATPQEAALDGRIIVMSLGKST